MNIIPTAKYESVMAAIDTGMSLREIVKHTGVAKQTIARLRHDGGTWRPSLKEGALSASDKFVARLACRPLDANGNFTCMELESPSMRRTYRVWSLGYTLGGRGNNINPLPRGNTVDVTCGNDKCFAPEHVYLRPWKMWRESQWKRIAQQLEALPIDGKFWLDGYKSEEDRAKLRVNVLVHTLARFAIRSLPTGGVEIIRVGTYGSAYRGVKEEFTKTRHPILVGTERDWESEYDGDCVLAPGWGFALRKRREGIACPKGRVRAVTCGNPRCYAQVHLYLREFSNKARRRNDIGSTTLGMFWGTSKSEIAIAESPRCAIRGCAFISHGESSLCVTHQQFFEAEGYEQGVIDVNDMFADDNGGDSLYTTGMLYEDRYNWLNVRKEGSCGKSAAEKQNDAWWEENVIAKGLMVDGVVTPKIRGSVLPEVLAGKKSTADTRLTPGVGAQTSLHGKMRRHDKKKIRKAMRKRPAGYVGSHPDHDPQYFSRDTIRGLEYDDVNFDVDPAACAGKDAGRTF
jgi:hypothetical protein